MGFREYFCGLKRQHCVAFFIVAAIGLAIGQQSVFAEMMIGVETRAPYNFLVNYESEFIDLGSCGAGRMSENSDPAVTDEFPSDRLPIEGVATTIPIEESNTGSRSTNHVRTFAPQAQIGTAVQLPQPELVGCLNRDDSANIPVVPPSELLRPPQILARFA